ncbi:MAG: hypothetical protein IT363_11670 [Methanoregulaceae archaeon]|nr:hypothetical protein [Methanoregulaceae archaeon]
MMHRRNRFGLVGLLALLMGLVPTSVLSSYFKAECGMPCCADPEPAVSCCAGGSAEPALAPAPDTASCPCEIAPSPSPDIHGVVAAQAETPTSWVVILADVPSWRFIPTVTEVALPATGLRGPPSAALRASPPTRAPPFSWVA